MATYPIRTFGDPVLRARAEPVTAFTSDIGRLIDDMLETMYEAPGVGLAAPQIGVSKRVFVFDAGEGPYEMVNPEIVASSGEWEYEEGCLSVPDKFWPITRAAFVRARGFDRNGDPVEHAGDDLLGRVLQHELDHLDGTLLLERLPRRVRKQALRELREEALQLPGPL